MAGVELHRKIIEQTIATGDQDHFDLIHLSASRIIGDRTEYLLGNSDQNPGLNMTAAVRLAIHGLVDDSGRLNTSVVVGVPCNTFHAPVIFESFRRELARLGPNLTVVHMLQESLDLITARRPDSRTIGLLSTTGTRKSGVWRHLLEEKGYTVVEVPEDQQDWLHESIYHREWGLKAVSPASEQSRRRVESSARTLIQSGAEAVILGCTELPLALPQAELDGVALIDPVLALARGMIHSADPQRLRPLGT